MAQPNPLDPARKAYERIKSELYRLYGPAADKMLAKMSVADSGELILGEGQSLDPIDDPVGTTTYIDELAEQKPVEFPTAEPSNVESPKTLLQKLEARKAKEAAATQTAGGPAGVDVNAAAQEAEVKKAVIDDIRRLSPQPLNDSDMIWLSEQPLEELWETAATLVPKPPPDPTMQDVGDGVQTNNPGAVRVVQPRRGAR